MALPSRGPAALAWLLCSAGSAVVVAGSGAVRGVAADGHGRYADAAGFRCFDGSRTVPASAVNDDFCDCADGSDEPGTGACAGLDGTLFHCANEGSTPQLIYASRVDDGVCDCCDGSDEAGLVARVPGRAPCENRCEEDGRRESQERAARMAKLQEGLKAKKDIAAAAAKERQDWQAQLERLRQELPALEAALAEAKQSKEAAEAAAAASAGDAELKALKDTVEKQKAQIEQLQRDLEACRAGAGGAAAGGAAAAGGSAEAKPVVSEYAKWMEGAGSTPGAIDVQDHLSAGVDLGDEELAGSEEEPAADPAPAKAVASDAVSEAESKLKSNKDETQRLEKKLKQVDEDRLAYASLVDRCLSKSDHQYTYKVCFFNDAKQDSTLLGKWKGWTGPREAHFSDGYMCPGGPARDLRVVFECSGEEAVLDVSEPSRCSYLAVVAHPGACDESDEAALVRPPVRHPKDEL